MGWGKKDTKEYDERQSRQTRDTPDSQRDRSAAGHQARNDYQDEGGDLEKRDRDDK